jgi:hypothetical protein
MYKIYDASSSGPVSSMPGSMHTPPADAGCVNHPTVKATARLQGETDSMGCEYVDLCAVCVARVRKAVADKDTSGVCDWCNAHATSLRNRRDYDEGSCGRVYSVCKACIDNDNAEADAEVESHGDFNPWDNYLD